MEYRLMDNIGVKTSLLGFGGMRFPTKDGKIDRDESVKMLDKAISAGVNYIDTAWFYHGGESEEFLGYALKKYDRSSLYIATKLPCWDVKTIADVDRILDIQMGKLDVDYVDFYLLHGLNKNSWKTMSEMGVYEYCLELKKKGKIKHLGFSFHDDYNAFDEIINARKWDFCQIQLNYMDRDEQATLKGYEMAEKLGVPVIIMEPIKGGSLANLPDDISKYMKEVNPDKSIASWAMRWAGGFSGVKVVLSGMSTMEQVEDNLKTYTDFKPLNDEEQKVIEDTIVRIKTRVRNNCTSCNYCMPCPVGVNIPGNFRIWNQFGRYENKGDVQWAWNNQLKAEEKANNCTSCGKCEEMCPQKIEIRNDLVKLQKEFASFIKG